MREAETLLESQLKQGENDGDPNPDPEEESDSDENDLNAVPLSYFENGVRPSRITPT